MSVVQVAEAIGMTTESVYRRIRLNEIDALPFGRGGYQVDRAEVHRWLLDERRKATAKWQERIDRLKAAS